MDVAAGFSAISVSDPPTGTTAKKQGEALPVSWTTNAAVSSGSSAIWVVSAGNGWYGGKIVAANGTASYSNSVDLNVPVDAGYNIYVYWRATIGSGAWSDIYDDAPGHGGRRRGRLQRDQRQRPAQRHHRQEAGRVPGGQLDDQRRRRERRVQHLGGSAGNGWYGGKIVANNGTASYPNKTVDLNVPVDTGYHIYVYWRATIGSGAWSNIYDDSPGTVDVAAAGFSAISVSAAHRHHRQKQGESLPVSWTTNAAVSSGEFSIWVVSADYGSWYGGTIVANNGTASYPNKTVDLNVPVGTGYHIYVYWRSTIGSGAWSNIYDDAPGTVDVTAP